MDKLKKLKGRSADEFYVRVRQKLVAWGERQRWTAQSRLPGDAQLLKLLSDSSTSPAQLLDSFRTRQATEFFASFADQSTTISELKTRWPENIASCVAEANEISEGRFNLLGFRGLSFGNPINWHFEPTSGKSSPLVHWSRFDELDAGTAGDKKVTWELNRHQHFVTLGRAYWLTGDERYAEVFVDQVGSWMESNPPTLGLNWLSSLEVGFRAISWIWALHYFRRSPKLTEAVFLKLLKYLWLHGRHLENYLSTYSSPNTHLTGEALGLYYLGTLLPVFRQASRWRNTGERILLAEVKRQVRPDGVYFEQTSYYHRYTVDFYLHFYILAQANGKTFISEVGKKLQLLLDHLMYLTRPDGTTPFFGDDDGGKLLRFEERAPADFRAALATGAALFARSDYKFVAESLAEETLWLLGRDGCSAFDNLTAKKPAETSKAFPDGGYYVMRDGWSNDANYLLFDCGIHGTMNCGHAHADALSVQVAVQGRTMLVDPGTHIYTAAKEMRDWFRGSPAHNTLTIDGESSSVPDGPFSWKTVANVECTKWISRDRFDFVSGKHDGYGRVTPPVDHSRSVLLIKGGYWIIRDQIKTSGQHQADLWFHFEADIKTNLASPAILRASFDQAGLDIAVFSEKSEWKGENGWISHCYGEKESAPVYVSTTVVNKDTDLYSFLLPQSARSSLQKEVREVEAVGGRAFEINHQQGFDIVMVRSSIASQVETERMASDFDLTWARFVDRHQTTPNELVLIGGQTLQFEGRQLLKSTRKIEFVVTSRVGDKFCVETEQGILDVNLPSEDLESILARLSEQATV